MNEVRSYFFIACKLTYLTSLLLDTWAVQAKDVTRNIYSWNFQEDGINHTLIVIQPSTLRASFSHETWPDEATLLILEAGLARSNLNIPAVNVAKDIGRRQGNRLIDSVSTVDSETLEKLKQRIWQLAENKVDSAFSESGIDSPDPESSFSRAESIRDNRVRSILAFKNPDNLPISQLLNEAEPLLTFSVVPLRGPDDLAQMEARLIGTSKAFLFKRPEYNDTGRTLEIYWQGSMGRTFFEEEHLDLRARGVKWPIGGVIEAKKLAGPGVSPAIHALVHLAAVGHGFFIATAEPLSSSSLVTGPISAHGYYELQWTSNLYDGRDDVEPLRFYNAAMIVLEAPEGAQERMHRRNGFRTFRRFQDPARPGNREVWMKATPTTLAQTALAEMNRMHSKPKLVLSEAVIQSNVLDCHFYFQRNHRLKTER